MLEWMNEWEKTRRQMHTQMSVFINAKRSTTVAHEWTMLMVIQYGSFFWMWLPLSCHRQSACHTGWPLMSIKIKSLRLTVINWHLSRFCSFQRFDFRWFIRLWAAFSQTMTFYCSKILFTIFHSERVFSGLQMEQLKCLLKWIQQIMHHSNINYKRTHPNEMSEYRLRNTLHYMAIINLTHEQLFSGGRIFCSHSHSLERSLGQQFIA